MNPLFLEPNEQAKAGILRAHSSTTGESYFDKLENLLHRAKHMASGLGNATDPAPHQTEGSGICHAEISAIALTIADQIEAAQALLDGLYADLSQLQAQTQTTGTEGKP